MLQTIVFGMTVGLSSSTQAGSEVTVQRNSLPPAVQQAVERETKGSRVKGFTKEVEKGATLYEVETVRDGRTRDLLFDADGRLVAVEEDIALDAVPAAALKALRARGTVTRVESVTKGKTTTYEGHLDANGKRIEVTVGADGRVIEP